MSLSSQAFIEDAPRLLKQQELVEFYMKSGQWFTLQKLGALISNGNQAGVSARIRQLRRMGYEVVRRRTAKRAVWEYKAVKK